MSSWSTNPLVGVAAGAVGGGIVATVNQWIDHRRSVKHEALRSAREDARETKAEQRAADSAILMKTRSMITEQGIGFLRDHDFGGAWHRNEEGDLRQYCRVARQQEWSFADPELESLRSAFADALISWANALNKYAGEDIGSNGHATPSCHQYAERFDNDPNVVAGRAMWEEAKTAMNTTSSAVVPAWETFIAAARRLFPGAFTSSPK